MDRIGRIERTMIEDPFEALINSIVSQQISSKALATVWGRLCTAVQAVTPEAILGAEEGIIRAAGISGRKAAYMKSAAEAALSGEISFDDLASMPDSELVKTLTALPGIGNWSAEMLLIFSFNRMDVLSEHDFGIRKGLAMLHPDQPLTKAQFPSIKKRYSPYGSVASLYLWEIARGR